MNKRDGAGLTRREGFEIQHRCRDFLLQARLARLINEVADSGGAPMSYLPDGERVVQCDLELVLTDAHRTRCIGDVKAKSAAAWWASRQYHSTGIDDRHMQAYRRQSSELSVDALVFFVHKGEAEVRYCSVWSPLWDQGDGDGDDMWFVPYYRLPLLARWDGDRTFDVVGEPFVRVVAGTQLTLDLPFAQVPVGVKGYLQP